MKTYLRSSSTALLLALAIPLAAYAQVPGNDQMPVPPPNVSDSNDQQMPPPAQPGQSSDIRNRLQSDYQAGMQNLQNNRDYRNTMMADQPGFGSSTPGMPPGMMPPMRPGMPFPGNASTSPWQGGPNGPEGSSTMPRLRLPPRLIPPLMRRFASSSPIFASSTLVQQLTVDHQSQQSIRADAFAFLQGNLIQQSNQALSNLEEIQTRIASKIQAETAQGVDMTNANALMATANADITAAQTAIQALSAYVPSSGSSGLTATSSVELGQARQLGSAAIQAVDAVRQALGQVVNAIAQAAGTPGNGSSTPPMPPPPTDQ